MPRHTSCPTTVSPCSRSESCSCPASPCRCTSSSRATKRWSGSASTRTGRSASSTRPRSGWPRSAARRRIERVAARYDDGRLDIVAVGRGAVPRRRDPPRPRTTSPLPSRPSRTTRHVRRPRGAARRPSRGTSSCSRWPARHPAPTSATTSRAGLVRHRPERRAGPGRQAAPAGDGARGRADPVPVRPPRRAAGPPRAGPRVPRPGPGRRPRRRVPRGGARARPARGAGAAAPRAVGGTLPRAPDR